MSGSLSVQPGSLRNYSQQHGDVATAVQGVNSSTPSSATVATSYGNIAAPMSGALSDLLGARGGALESTVSRANQLADGLRNAAGLYEKSDQDGAGAVNAASDRSGSPSGSPSGGTPSSAASTASNASGQMLSQVGQQAGQIATQMGQTAGQAVAGLTQVPSQVMQGVQQIVETAMGAGGTPGGGEPAPGPSGGAPSHDPSAPAGEQDLKAPPGDGPSRNDETPPNPDEKAPAEPGRESDTQPPDLDKGPYMPDARPLTPEDVR